MNFITDYSSWENGDYVVTIRLIGRNLGGLLRLDVPYRKTGLSKCLSGCRVPCLISGGFSRTSQRYNVDVLPQEID